MEGLPAERYFAALGELLLVASGSVDPVRMADAPEALARRIRAHGARIDG